MCGIDSNLQWVLLNQKFAQVPLKLPELRREEGVVQQEKEDVVPLLHPKRCAIFEALQDLQETYKRLALEAFGRWYHVCTYKQDLYD